MTNNDTLQDGLKGCGASIAYARARSGLGKDLSDAASLPHDKRHHGLSSWTEAIATELRTNKSKFLNRTYPAVAALLPLSATAFPDRTVLDLYLNPLTSKAQTPTLSRLAMQSVTMPDVTRIASCCELYFQWGLEQEIIKRFETLLLDGLCLRSLIAVCASQPWNLHPSTLIRSIHLTRIHPGTLLTEYRVEVDATDIHRLLKIELKGLRVPPSLTSTSRAKSHSSLHGVRIWLPGPVVEAALPTLVEAYCRRKAAAQRKRKTGGTRPGGAKAEKSVQGTEIVASGSCRSNDGLRVASSQQDRATYISSDDGGEPKAKKISQKSDKGEVLEIVILSSDSE